MSSGPSTERGTAEPGAPDEATRSEPSAPEPAPETGAVTTVTGEETFGATTEGTGRRRRGRRRRRLSFLQELPILLLVAFLLALLIKTFLVQAFYIPSESMDPTLKIGDRVLVNKLTYHFHPPRRGDIIVFQDPHPTTQSHRNPFQAFVHWIGEGMGVQTSPDKDFIKRVIGLPGDRVRIDDHGTVFINDKPITEPYLSPIKDVRPYPETVVPQGQLFVMGDNRTDSNDSRYGLGFIPMEKVVGRAFVIVWPPSRFRWLSGIHYQGS